MGSSDAPTQFSPAISSQSSQSTSDCSSDSSSISTPIKLRTVNLSDHRTDPMKTALKADLTGHTFQEIGVVDFVTTVWGLKEDVADKIRTATFTIPEEPANSYKSVLESRSQNERHLHEPFLKIYTDLLNQVCGLLGISPEDFDNTFWDGDGEGRIRNQYTTRKPDLVNLYRLAAGIRWPLVNGVLEFKRRRARNRDRTRGTSLAPIQEDAPLDTPITSKSGRKNKSKKSSRSAQWKPAGSQPSSTSLQSDILSSIASTSTLYSTTTVSSGKRSAEEALGPDIPTGRTKKRPRVADPTLDQLQLATYALECLGASSRHYVTGIFIDEYDVSLWCYNRTTVFRSEIFIWNNNIQFLAMALFALTQCDMKHAGFDPNVHRFIPPQLDDPVPASAILPLERPVEEMKDLCFRFPSGVKDVPDWIFWIQEVLYTYRGIVGRGTFVATVRAAIIGEVLRKGSLAFKQSWQYQSRPHEAAMIAKLRERLPKYWKKHLPEVIFHIMFAAESLGHPHTQLKEQIPELLSGDVQDRDLHVLVSTLCHKLWEAKDVDEFKRVFLDCLECHYHAYHTGRILHRDISENNLMIFRADDSAEAVGVLNDFDMATELPEAEATGAQVTAAHHRTGTLPFMALELLESDEAEPVHLYRYDLESFFYILIWAATHYDFESRTKRSTPGVLRDWLDPNSAAKMKMQMISGTDYKTLTPLVLAPFEGLWNTWVFPLRSLFADAKHARTHYICGNTPFDNATINGNITFEKFMAAIGETPRGLHPKSPAIVETST